MTFYRDNNQGKVIVKYSLSLTPKEQTTEQKLKICGIVIQKLFKNVGLRRLDRFHYDIKKRPSIPIEGRNDNDPKTLVLFPG